MVSIIDVIIITLFINTVLLALGIIIFGIACMRDKELISYLPIYITFFIGNLFILNQFVDNIFRIIAQIFFVGTTFNLFIAAFLDYYKIFIKSNLKTSHISKLTFSAFIFSSLIVNMQILMIFILLTTSIMLLRVYLKARSAVKLLFMTCGIVSMMSTISQLIPYFELELGLYLAYSIGTVFITILLINGIVAILEQEIKKAMKIKNTLKDNYSHDLGNILHSIFMSYELIMNKKISEKELNNVNNLLKDKIIEASELVKEIRKI
ncbi:MAG: hypothetical protein ACFFBP_11175 [Promethearchaeota archaeon]